jgi:hypothetical protein
MRLAYYFAYETSLTRPFTNPAAPKTRITPAWCAALHLNKDPRLSQSLFHPGDLTRETGSYFIRAPQRGSREKKRVIPKFGIYTEVSRPIVSSGAPDCTTRPPDFGFAPDAW